jgi:hypothetical protein
MNDVFIIGTGNSLLNLTEQEVEHINSCENIVVNSHLIFYDLLKIKPKNWVYVDNDYKTDTILNNTYKNADYLGVNWFLGDKHIERLNELGIKPNSQITKFNSKYYNSGWADSLEERPFWCSILGTAVNLSTILFPYSNIKIIGMDGVGGQHFYTDNVVNYSSDIKKYHTVSVSNYQYHNSVTWFKWGIPIMIKEVEKRGSKIFHCNQDSIFINENHNFYQENQNLKPDKFFEYKSVK